MATFASIHSPASAMVGPRPGVVPILRLSARPACREIRSRYPSNPSRRIKQTKLKRCCRKRRNLGTAVEGNCSMSRGNDWKNALQTQLGSLVREAWLEYQSSPQLIRAWASAGVHQKELSSIREREAMRKPPDRIQFTWDLCSDVGN